MHKNDTNLFSAWDFPLSLVLLTRLPVPRLPETVFVRQAAAVWAFPLVGLVIGLLACLTGWLALTAGLPAPIAAVMVVATLIVSTGAMHEDGLADTVDGFWGGFTVERRLEIMKDSHIGTYGVLALIFSQLLRIALVAALLAAGGFAQILAACMVSRAVMPVLMTALPNARNAGLSHSVGGPKPGSTGLGLVLALLSSILLLGSGFFVPWLCAAMVAGFLARLAITRIGGQTGDVLGATQQLTELAFLTAVVAAL